MVSQLRTNLLQLAGAGAGAGAAASPSPLAAPPPAAAMPANSPFTVSSIPAAGVLWRHSSTRSAAAATGGTGLHCIAESSSSSCNYCQASGSGRGRQVDEQSLWRPVYVFNRRQVLNLASRLVAAAGTAMVIIPDITSAAETVEKAKSYTNIDDARVAGDKLRDIKEAADGPVLVSSSGIKYRELEKGTGDPIGSGDVVSVYYTISRLNGYYLDSVGYGKEGKNDVGETLTFQYGMGMVPEAVDGGMEGMQVGGKRRILVTPEHGWVRPDLLPRPTSFFAERRLSERKTTQALLIEVELVKSKPSSEFYVQ